MELITVLFIAVGVAMDVFAVSLGIGCAGQATTARAKFRLAFHFGLFQGGMTLLGYLLGSTIVDLIANFDHWVAFILLAFVGGRMIKEGLEKVSMEKASMEKDSSAEELADKRRSSDPSRGGTLVLLSIATSIDALAVGLSMAMIQAAVVAASLIIGLTSSGFSLIGLRWGCDLGERFGKRMEVIGGLILIGIGVRIVVTHLMG